MRRQAAALLLALLALLVLVTGCGSSGGNDEVKVGVVSNLTGPDTVNGREMVRGAELAAKQFNARGGADGRKLKVIVEDSEYKPVLGVTAARKLIDVDNVTAIESIGGSSVMVPMAKFARAQDGVIVNTGASSPDLREVAGTVFSVLPLDDVFASGFAEWVHQLGIERVATLMPSNPYGTVLNASFTEAFEKLGGSVVASVNFKEGQQDYLPEMQRIKSGDPEVIVTGAYGADAGLLWKQAAQVGLDVKWLGAYPTGIPIRNAAGKVFGVELGYDLPSAASFREAYEAEYGGPPRTSSAVYGYDGMALLAQALKQSGGEGGQALKDALTEVGRDFVGATGTIQLDPDGQRKNAPYVFIAMKDDGTFVPLKDRLELVAPE